MGSLLELGGPDDRLLVTALLLGNDGLKRYLEQSAVFYELIVEVHHAQEPSQTLDCRRRLVSRDGLYLVRERLESEMR